MVPVGTPSSPAILKYLVSPDVPQIRSNLIHRQDPVRACEWPPVGANEGRADILAVYDTFWCQVSRPVVPAYLASSSRRVGGSWRVAVPTISATDLEAPVPPRWWILACRGPHHLCHVGGSWRVAVPAISATDLQAFCEANKTPH